MRITETGTYIDGNGNSFFFRAGAVAPDDVRLQESSNVKAGAPENRMEPVAETRDEAPAPRKRKSDAE